MIGMPMSITMTSGIPLGCELHRFQTVRSEFHTMTVHFQQHLHRDAVVNVIVRYKDVHHGNRLHNHHFVDFLVIG